MLSTLDPETQREWELITAPRADIPLTTEMESKCQALELLQTTQPANVQPTTCASHSTRIKFSKPSHTYVATQIQCSLCRGSHRLFTCDQFLKISVQQRRNYVKQSKRCFNYLQVYTRRHAYSKQVCRQCNSRPHILLHFDKHQHYDARSVNNNSPTNGKGPLTNNKLTANEQNNAPTEVNTYCTFKGKTQNQVFLATAIVELRNNSGQYIPCSALLDSASQSHFITERRGQRLRLSKTQTHSSIQGINNSSAVTNHYVSIHKRSRHTDWHDSLNCAVWSDITGITPATKLDTSCWRIPTDIKLADENFNLPGDIDLLLEADLSYEMLQSGKRTRPVYPLLQETMLTWTLSGTTPVISSQWLITQLLLREDNRLENNLHRFWEVEPM